VSSQCLAALRSMQTMTQIAWGASKSKYGKIVDRIELVTLTPQSQLLNFVTTSKLDHSLWTGQAKDGICGEWACGGTALHDARRHNL